MYGKGLRALSLVTTVVLTATFALVFFYAPNDADLVLGLRGGRAAIAGPAADVTQDDVRALYR